MKNAEFLEICSKLNEYREQAPLRERLISILAYLSLPRDEAIRLVDRLPDADLREMLAHAFTLKTSFERKEDE